MVTVPPFFFIPTPCFTAFSTNGWIDSCGRRKFIISYSIDEGSGPVATDPESFLLNLSFLLVTLILL